MKKEQKIVAAGAAGGVAAMAVGAPGMAATAYLNLGMILFVLYWIMKGR